MKDDAIILNAAQAAAIRAANPPGSNRRIEPRALKDGTFLLNADVLDDPGFTGVGKPWRAALLAMPAKTAQTLTQIDTAEAALVAAEAQPETP